MHKKQKSIHFIIIYSVYYYYYLLLLRIAHCNQPVNHCMHKQVSRPLLSAKKGGRER